MTIKNVAIIGANGTVGPAILRNLVKSAVFNVTVLTRASSTSEYSEPVRIVRVSDSLHKEDLVEALKGQDALVISFSGYHSEDQIKLADAALEAGVKRLIPADFGSCDSSSQAALDLIPLYGVKKKVREYLQQLEGRGSLSWTSIVCGHFFDWGLASGFLRFNVNNREALILDNGETKFSATTLDTIGLAVVRILQKESETKNKMLYIQSVCITANQLLKAFERITGAPWTVEYTSSEEFIKREKPKMDNGDDEAREAVVFAQGVRDANWENKPGFANDLLGIEAENLDEVVKKAIS